MTRILVQRGSSGSASTSSNQNRPSPSAAPSSVSTSSSPAPAPVPAQSQGGNSTHNPVASAQKDEQIDKPLEQTTLVDGSEYCGSFDSQGAKVDDHSKEPLDIAQKDDLEKISQSDMLAKEDFMSPADLGKRFGELSVVEEENEGLVGSSFQTVTGSSCPPPPPVPPPRPSSMNSPLRRSTSGCSNSARIGPPIRFSVWPPVPARTSPTHSRPSSPRSHGETEGYNSADEQNPCYGSSYDDSERDHQFEMDIRRVKGLEVRKMIEDGNCLFRAVADQVYGDSESYDLTRQMCIDYMEKERDHFSQFITEGFTSYCKRKRRDKVYGNNIEIQALSEMFNRPIHIYSYSTEPINTFQRGYNTDTPPIRLSYHHGNHYNSLVDPRRLTVGAGLGFSCLRGTNNVDTNQVKAAIRAQQDQQIENALLAEGRFYSDLELTEKEIERMVMEASRAEYLNQKICPKDSSTSGAEPSSSGAIKLKKSGSTTVRERKKEGGGGGEVVLQDSVQILLSMGFSYLQAVEAYSIFGDDVDSMVGYLIETNNTGSRCKGKKATE